MTASVESLRAMLAKAGEKLEAAERELQAGFPGEAASRSYYAVFHAMAAVLATRELSFSSHTQTIGAFNREFVKSGVFPSGTTRLLQSLFEDRQIADYDWVNAVDKETAGTDVNNAKELVESCRTYVEKYLSNHAT
jgi:uncharacterized protein (UPF0332 family)